MPVPSTSRVHFVEAVGLVERLARAMCRSRGLAPDDDSGGHSSPNYWHLMEDARACMDEIEAAGLVIVPREPTEEMLRPGDPPYRFHPSEFRELWAAMIAASPKQG